MLKTNVERLQSTTKLFGIYRGVVEDRDDPLRLGRVRVRIWGVHTEEQAGDINKAPWEELQWAHPIGPNFEGSISGQGAFCVPLQGAHVMIFFENGNMMQPRYFGTASGFPVDGAKFQQKDFQDGYRDPDVFYPLTDHIKEHDWQRLARIDKLAETYLQLKRDNLDLAVPIAWGSIWDEQPPMYEAEYPDNNVFATHDDFTENIVIELDSTFAAPRLSWWHPSKSYMEVNVDGLMTFRNTFHRWDICDGFVHTHYMKHHFKTVSDTLIFLIEKDEYREIKGNRWTKVAQDWKTVSGDSISKSSGSDQTWIVGNYTLTVEGETKCVHWLDRSIQVGGLDTLYIGGSSHWYAEVNMNLRADEEFKILGGTLVSIISPAKENGEVAIQGYTKASLQSPLGTVNVIGAITNVGSSTGITNVGGATVYLGTAPDEYGAAVFVDVVDWVDSEEPPESPNPPAPYVPEDFIPPDEPVEMPKPGC